MLLANVSSTKANSADALEGKRMEEVMGLFTFDMPDDGEWADGMLPMWGKSDPTHVHHSSGGVVPSLGTIYLIRAVARVDVGLNMNASADGASQFNETAQGITYMATDGSKVEVELSKVFLYNTNSKGRVAPFSENPDIWDVANRKAKAPSLLEPATKLMPMMDRSDKIKDKKLLLRDIYIPEAANTPTKASTGANGSTLPDTSTDYLKRPYLVVGLVGADRDDPTKTTYFRVDYLHRIGTEPKATYEYLPLLRNYRYLVNIIQVDGPGFDSPEEAMRGPAANIMYNVEAWEESTMSNVQYDGRYMLGISEDELTYYNRKSSQSVIIRTSWPEGWEAAVTSPDSDWLTIDKTSGDSGADGSLVISVADNSDANAVMRQGVVTITAGRMSWKVKVKQLNESIVSIKITGHKDQGDEGKPIVVRNFTAKAETKKITIEYEPANAKLEGPQGLLLPKDFIFKEIEEESLDGRAVYEISVNEFDDVEPFQSLADGALFTVNADGKTSAASIVLVQTKYNVVPYQDQGLTNVIDDEETFYLLDGKEKEFYIQANTPYEIEVVEYENDANVPLIQEGFQLNVPQQKSGVYKGEPINFTPINNISGPSTNKDAYLGFVVFEIRSPRALFEPKRFKIALGSGIKQQEANCYMLCPQEMGVLIPISRINTAHNEYELNKTEFDEYYNKFPGVRDDYNWIHYSLPIIDSNDKWEPVLIWSDIENKEHVRPVNKDGTAGIRAIKKVQVENKDYIFVLPGKDKKKQGNAVIACVKGDKSVGVAENNILWSWHIWVQSEYPKEIQGKWLDRNLGAIATATTQEDADKNKDTHGTQYQFGRKDPFPLPTSEEYRLLVRATGERQGIGQERNERSMKNAIQLPLSLVYQKNNWLKETKFSSVVRSWRIWYSTWGGSIYDGTNRSEDIDGTKKSVFDPCPYGWKVPAYGNESNWDGVAEMILPRVGMYLDGSSSNWKEDYTIYGVSSVRKSDHEARYINYTKQHHQFFFGRSATRLIRCVKNSGYQMGGVTINNEYNDYTNFLPGYKKP